MRITLAYGNSGLPLEVPEAHPGVRVLRKREAPRLAEPADALRRALAEPLEAPPLAELARSRRDAVVVISDLTRPVPNPVLLPPILSTLEAAGLPRESITILIATGMHRPNLGEELRALVGPEIAAGYRVLNHLSRDPAEVEEIGRTRAGIPVQVNRHYLKADLKILTGFIEPHLWAGYSGGAKSILPGLSGIETMQHMHGFAMVDDPRTCYGRLDDNPFREACWEVAQMAGVDFILNVTLSESKEITGVFSGHPLVAHRTGADFLAPYVFAEVPERVDLALTTCGGDPLDRTLYQTIKGMSGAEPILKPGARMVVASACSEGVGGPEFTELMTGAGSPADLLGRLRQPGFFRRDQWAAQEICSILGRHPVGLHTDGIGPEEVRRCHLEPVADLQPELDRALARGESVAVIPDGPYVIPRLAE